MTLEIQSRLVHELTLLVSCSKASDLLRLVHLNQVPQDRMILTEPFMLQTLLSTRPPNLCRGEHEFEETTALLRNPHAFLVDEELRVDPSVIPEDLGLRFALK